MKDIWKIYTEYPSIWQVMLEDIERAEKEIFLEQYILNDINKGIGKKFWSALEGAVDRGVKVRAILDAQGSWSVPIQKLAKGKDGDGIEVQYFTFSTHRWRIFFKSIFREHRKLLVIDKRVAHIGGTILQDKAKNWGELSVRFEGEMAYILGDAFLSAWYGLKNSNTFVTINQPETKDGFSVLGSSPLPEEHHTLESILGRVGRAEKYIKITSPYFVPESRLWRALLRARKRGVEIQMILPQDTDNFVAKYAGFSYYKKVLGRGIKIYLFQEYIHAKSVLVDGRWCTFGSTNIDNVALLHNYELNVESTNPEFLKEIEKSFEGYKRRSKELSLEEWKRRSIFTKMLEKIFALLRKVA